MVRLLLLIGLFVSSFSFGSISDCKNVYVGRIWVEKGLGLTGVVYVNGSTGFSGSYWSRFTGWTSEERKEALSILLTAKAAQKTVRVETENENGCGIQEGPTVTKSLYLETQP